MPTAEAKRDTFSPTSDALDCPACTGLGQVYVHAYSWSHWDDGLDSRRCPSCQGSGRVCRPDVRDTEPAPPPDGCESEVA
jgi:DnaJ-class molecular chaperone